MPLGKYVVERVKIERVTLIFPKEKIDEAREKFPATEWHLIRVGPEVIDLRTTNNQHWVLEREIK